MSARACLCAALMVLVAGCATQPETSAYKPDASTMGDDTEARNRARAFHVGETPPVVRRYLVDGTERG